MNISIHLNKKTFCRTKKFPFTFIWKASIYFFCLVGIAPGEYQTIWISIAHFNADELLEISQSFQSHTHNIYIWHFSFAPDKVCGMLFLFFICVNYANIWLPIFWRGICTGSSVGVLIHSWHSIHFCLTFNSLTCCFIFFSCTYAFFGNIWK